MLPGTRARVQGFDFILFLGRVSVLLLRRQRLSVRLGEFIGAGRDRVIWHHKLGGLAEVIHMRGSLAVELGAHIVNCLPQVVELGLLFAETQSAALGNAVEVGQCRTGEAAILLLFARAISRTSLLASVNLLMAGEEATRRAVAVDDETHPGIGDSKMERR